MITVAIGTPVEPTGVTAIGRGTGPVVSGLPETAVTKAFEDCCSFYAKHP